MSIEKFEDDSYELTCDYCEEAAEDTFEEFQDAVQFKKDNGWRSVKDNCGSWHDLCPDCQSPDIVREVKDRC